MLLIRDRPGPPGSFCTHGSTHPTKCSLGSWCPAKAVRDTNFLPVAFLLLLDILLVAATIWHKMRARYNKKGQQGNKKGEKMLGAKSASRKYVREPGYRQLDDEQYAGFTDNDIPMEPTIRAFNRRPTGFEHLGALEAEFIEDLHNGDAETKTDLHLFVQSLSKCLGATKFGLSFEFQDLGFKPPKSAKPILSDVSGAINAGSLWGVMGASGAGKCRIRKILITSCTANDYSHLC
jgi:ABC-type glutathione transport system ATPase component